MKPGYRGSTTSRSISIPAEEWQSIAGWSPSNTITDDTPNLDTAISEQLGLRLVRGKGPAPVLVVDKAEKNPVEN